MTNQSGILEKIDGNNVIIHGKNYFILPNVQPYLKNFHIGDTVEFTLKKGEKGSINFLKGSHVKGGEVPPETLQEIQQKEEAEKWADASPQSSPMKPAGTSPAEGSQELSAGDSSHSARQPQNPPLSYSSRDLREVQVIRLSCLMAAIEFMKVDAKSPPDLHIPLLQLAERFEGWIWRVL